MRRARAILCSLTVFGGALFASEAGAMARAGALVENTASVRFDLDGATQIALSNETLVQVAELVRFELEIATPVVTGVRAGELRVYAFDIHNTGNGDECFALSAVPAVAGSPAIELVAIHADTNGDGVFDEATDLPLAPGDCGPQLAPGGAMRFFAIGRTPDAGSSQLNLSVTPSPGGGGFGVVFAGRGDGGGDAVYGFGPDAGQARFEAQASRLTVSLQKTQSVEGDAARVSAAPGDIITYSLRVSATGEGNVAGAIVADPLPASLSYVPNSLRLDGAALSDGDGDDAGDAGENNITVRLPDTAAPFEHMITFRALVRQTPQT